MCPATRPTRVNKEGIGEVCLSEFGRSGNKAIQAFATTTASSSYLVVVGRRLAVTPADPRG